MLHLATRRHCGGFTYLALLLAIVIMGLVLGAAAEVWHTAVQREKERELLFVGNQFRNAIKLYYLDHARSYPPSLEDLLKDPHQPATRRYLRKIYHDPIVGGTEWGLVRREGGGIVGVHSLSEAQPIKITGFDRTDSSFDSALKYSEWVFAFQPRKLPTVQRANTTSNSVSSTGKGTVGDKR